MSDDFETMMRELRDEYIQSIPQKIADIAAHLKDEKWLELRNDFHKLKGTGRTYGIPEITLLGEAVEKICAEKTTAAPGVVPQALQLLKDIYARRLAQEEFPISTHPSFLEIRKISSTLE